MVKPLDISVKLLIGSTKAKERRIIHEELTYGKVNENAKRFVLSCFDEMSKEGAEGFVLGCTEFSLLIAATDVNRPLFDTIDTHAKAAVAFVLN